VYTFFGRKGSLPFGLADFSIADLISIFPAAIITLINIIPKAFFEFLKGISVHFVIPLIIGVAVRSVSGFRLNQFSFDANWIGSIAAVNASIISGIPPTIPVSTFSVRLK